jgi:hypothetical protein
MGFLADRTLIAEAASIRPTLYNGGDPAAPTDHGARPRSLVLMRFPGVRTRSLESARFILTRFPGVNRGRFAWKRF